jgi:hypothetical protein
MSNKRKSILILLVLTAVLTACAPGWLHVAPVGSDPQPVRMSGASASVSLASGTQDTDGSAGPEVEPLPAPPAAENPQRAALGRVTVQGLNLRAGPAINTVILGVLDQGAELEIEGRSENLKWLQVRVPGGAQGWVYSDYMDTQAVIADLPVKEAFGGPDSSPSDVEQDIRQPLNVQVSIENTLGIVYISGFPGDSKVIARLGEAGKAADLYVGESVTTANGNAVIRFAMPSLAGDEFNLVVSTASGDESVDVRIQYFHN